MFISLRVLNLMQIPGHARLAQFFSICLGQVFLIFDTKDIDRDSGFVCAQTNLIKLSDCSIRIFYSVKSVSRTLGLETVLFSLFFPSRNHNLHAGITSRMVRCNACMSLRFGSGWLVIYFWICSCTFILNIRLRVAYFAFSNLARFNFSA